MIHDGQLQKPTEDMDIIYLLIGCSITIAGIFLFGFLWSIRSGQYDDTYTPSVRMLFEPGETASDEPKPSTETNSPGPETEESQSEH